MQNAARQPSPAVGYGIQPLPMVVRALLGLLLLSVAAVAILDSLAVRMERYSPDMSARVAPWRGEAQARLAERAILANPTEPDAAKAERFARLALRRDPANVMAAYALAESFRIEGDANYSDVAAATLDMSWRHFPMQLAAARDAALAGDAPQAVTHMGAALTTNRAGRELIIPQLVQASGDPSLTPLLAPMLAARPGWYEAFVSEWVPRAPVPATMAALSSALDQLGSPFSPEVRSGIIARLIASGQWALALDEYRRARPSLHQAGQTLQDGYRHVWTLRPFDWQLADDDGRTLVEVEAAGDGPARLSADFSGPDTVAAASRLLMLVPGSYRLDAEFQGDGAMTGGNGIPASLQLQMLCESGGGAVLGTSQPTGRSARLDLLIPSGCPVQRLTVSISMRSPDGGIIRVSPIRMRKAA